MFKDQLPLESFWNLELERAKIQSQNHYAEQHSSTFVKELQLVTSKLMGKLS
jgi:hypothetical protein